MVAITRGLHPVRFHSVLMAAVLVAPLLVALPPAHAATPAFPIAAAAADADGGLDGDPATTERLYERFPVYAATRASRIRFGPSDGARRQARHVVLARADHHADALAGTALAGEGPLLLTHRDRLSAPTEREIRRVLPAGRRVYLLGGRVALGDAIRQRLLDLGYVVRRLAGATRIETAIAVADTARMLYGRDEVFLARATGSTSWSTNAWTDAISAGGLAAATGVPILFTPTSSLDPAVNDWLDDDGTRLTVLLGGRTALSDDVAAAVPNALRVAGRTSSGTAAAIARRLWRQEESGPRSYTIVPGDRWDGWAFGLAAAGLSADERAPILLATSGVTGATRGAVRACGDPKVDLHVIGDGSVVSAATREVLDALDGSACGPGGALRFAPALVPYSSCAELVDDYQESALERVGPTGLSEFWFRGGGGDGGGPIPQPSEDGGGDGGGTTGGTAGGEHSGTNVQEEGVDEPDIIDTDGEIAVAITQNELQIIDVSDAAPRLASTVELPGAGEHELLLGDGVVLVLRQRWYQESTELTLIDVSDPDEPVVDGTLSVTGRYLSARVIDGTVRLVLQTEPHGLEFERPERWTDAGMHRSTAENRDIVQDSMSRNWLPRYHVEMTGEPEQTDRAVACEDVAEPPQESGLGTLSVISFDMGSLEPTSSAAIAADGETVYASKERLVVATSRWNWELAGPDDGISTEVHAFDISDPTATAYVDSASFDGYLLNQFSLSMHEGHLRVAATEQAPWEDGGSSASAVTVFSDEGGVLTQVGRVGGLGEGEVIQAVRFMGDLGAVVTFRQTDPLYLIDLSDPTDPTVTGELKITGYSTYLHPIGTQKLLGVGRAANEDGRETGAQVSLFDISDLSAPALADREEYDDAYSEIDDDHHAFLYWPTTRLAVVPVFEYGDGESARALVFEVGAAQLSEAGSVTHADRADGVWHTRIRRSFVVDGRLYTVSGAGVLASRMDTLEPIGWAAF